MPGHYHGKKLRERIATIEDEAYPAANGGLNWMRYASASATSSLVTNCWASTSAC